MRLVLRILTKDLILLQSIGVLIVRLLAVHWTVLQSAIASLLMRQVLRRYVVCDVCHDRTFRVQHKPAKATGVLVCHDEGAGYALWKGSIGE